MNVLYFLSSPSLQLQERDNLEAERRRVEDLKTRCEEKEKLIPSQPESQREQLAVQLQQVTLDTLVAVGRPTVCSGVFKIKGVGEDLL